LVSKSLIVAEIDGPVARYRLLETTRAYAQEKLDESIERQAVARRHAEYYCALFEHAETEWQARPTIEWLADYAWQIDNLRAALDWAFSSDGDASIGIALTAAAVPLWMHLSLLEECRDRAERAVAVLTSGPDGDLRREMKLSAAVGASLIVTKGAAVPEVKTVWTRVLEIAVMLQDADYQSRALWGLWTFQHSNGHHEALALAQWFNALAAARSDRYDQLIGEMMIGTAQHFLGNQPAARRHLEHMLTNYVAPENKSNIVRFQVCPQVIARVLLAWSLWIEGLPEQAMETAETSIEDAKASAHALSLAYAMTLAACPIALLLGDLAAVERYVDVLVDQSTRYALRLWEAFGDCAQGVLLTRRGDAEAGLGLLRAGFAELGAVGSARFIRFQVAEALGRAGAIEEGLALVGNAIAFTERTGERWLTPELLRIKGELLLSQNAAGAAALAEDLFRHALAWAAGRGALSWELRAAMSLARLLCDQGRQADAAPILRPVYDRFTEGFGTADLIAAKALLDALG
jgi:predicted ATPase